MDNEDIVMGIDLGTTNSCVAIWKNKQLEIRQKKSISNIIQLKELEGKYDTNL